MADYNDNGQSTIKGFLGSNIGSAILGAAVSVSILLVSGYIKERDTRIAMTSDLEEMTRVDKNQDNRLDILTKATDTVRDNSHQINEQGRDIIKNSQNVEKVFLELREMAKHNNDVLIIIQNLQYRMGNAEVEHKEVNEIIRTDILKRLETFERDMSTQMHAIERAIDRIEKYDDKKKRDRL